MVCLAGLEPATSGLGIQRSVLLSYRHKTGMFIPKRGGKSKRKIIPYKKRSRSLRLRLLNLTEN